MLEADSVTVLTTGTSWTLVNFQQTFDIVPLVFIFPTDQGSEPCHTRIRNVTTSSFEVICAEPSGNNGPHAAQDTYYLAIEPGVHDLNGTRIEAGIALTDEEQNGRNISTPTGYFSVTNIQATAGGTPAVLAMIQTDNNGTGTAPSGPLVPWMTVAIESVTTTGHDLALERSEVDDVGITTEEEIGYVVWPAGSGDFIDDDGNTIDFDALSTPNRVVNGWDNTPCDTVNFGTPFASGTPLVFANKISRLSGFLSDNGGWLRRCGSPTTTGASFATDEDVFNDTERSQFREQISMLAFSDAFTVEAVTRASVRDVAAWANAQDRVFVDFETTAEMGTAAFELQRRVNGRWRSVPGGRVVAQPGRMGGAAYRIPDPEVRHGERHTYRLIEHELAGNQLAHGPFRLEVENESGTMEPEAVSNQPLRRGRPVELTSFARASESRFEKLAFDEFRRWSMAPLVLRQFPPLKIRTQREGGITAVSSTDVASAWSIPVALVERWIASGEVRLRHRGRDVAYFGASSLVFLARPLDDDDNPSNVYWLDHARGHRRPYPVPRSKAIAGHAQTTYTARNRVEQDIIPLTSVARPEGHDEYWHWHGFVGGDPNYGSASFALPVAHATGRGAASLKVHMVGVSAGSHALELRIDGEVLGVADSHGFGHFFSTFQIDPLRLVGRAELPVEITARDEGEGPSFVYLEAFDIEFERTLLAMDGRLEFIATDTGLARVDGLRSPQVFVWDVTDPDRPRARSPYVVSGPSGYGVSFAARQGHRYRVQDGATVSGPVMVEVDEPSSWRSPRNGADYVIVAPSFLEGQAQRLARHRRASGLDVELVLVEDLYDEFTHGLASVEALRSFFAYAVNHWRKAPDAAVLVGDGHYDALNRLGQGAPALPAHMIDVPGWGVFASDPRLVPYTSDGVPAIMLGRLPVSSAGELDRLIDKIVLYESGSHGGRTLLVADDHRRGDNFSLDVTALRDRVSLSADVFLFEGQPVRDARPLLISAWERARVVSYVGHGGFDRWSNSGLLRASDVPALPVGTHPIVMASTCLANGFHIPGFDGLGPALVRAPDRGAIAMFAPTAPSDNGDAVLMNEGFLRASRHGGRRLGEVLRETLEFYAKQGHRPRLIDVYTLIGDPGLVVAP